MNKLIVALALLLFYPAISPAQQKNAFIDPVTGALKAVGYVEANAPGEIKIPVTQDFSLKPGAWRWDGKTWTAMTSITEIEASELNDLAFAIDNAVRSPTVSTEVKDVLLKLKKLLASRW